MRSWSHWDYGFPGSKLRSRLSMTSWILLSCLYQFVVRMLRSRRDSLTLSVIFRSLLAVSQRSIDAWFGPGGVMDLLDHGVLHCRYLCRKTKVRVFRSLVLPVLLYRCETWTMTRDLRRILNSFDTRSLRRILGCRWSDFVSNEWLLRETQMRFVTCIVHELQLRLCGHVAHFPDADPAHQILSTGEPHEWRRPMGRPCATCLQQVEQHIKEMGMGQASAWEMAKRRPLENRRKVDAAMCCSGTCSHTCPDQCPP